MRVSTFLLLLLLWAAGLGAGVAPAAEERGLVAHYTFEEGQGALLHDRSGRGNDGRILGVPEWEKTPAGPALRFNGKDTYVDCGSGDSLEIDRSGSLEIWVEAGAVQGGLVNWSTGGGWNDERLVLAFNTWEGQRTLIWCLADGDASQHAQIEMPEPGAWAHYALALDGSTVTLFKDGLPVSAAAADLTPGLKGVPLWIGRCQGLGQEFLKGSVAEVRIYNRPLSEEEVLAHYKARASALGAGSDWLGKVRLTARLQPLVGKLRMDGDLRGLAGLPEGSSLSVALARPGQARAIRQGAARLAKGARKSVVFLDVAGLPPGDYELRAQARDAKAQAVGSAARARWSLAKGALPATAGKGIRPLNNLVAELLRVEKPPARPALEWSFTNPRAGWVYLRAEARATAAGSARVSLDGTTPVLLGKGGRPSSEVMRCLPVGPHKIRVRQEGGTPLGSLVVRAIPELVYCKFQYDPHITPHGPYDWAFLEKHVLPHVNCIVGSGDEKHLGLVEAWKRRGGKWLVETAARPFFQEMPAEEAYRYWTESPGFRQPLADGAIVDEFFGGESPRYASVNESVRRLARDAAYRGKAFIPYCGSMYGGKESEALIRLVTDAGYPFAWERYLREPPTEQTARAALESSLSREMEGWQKALPGCEQRMIVCFGYMSTPPESLDADPRVDYKVWMDLQFQHLATDPAFAGLYGLMEYTAGYADEETVRWAARLYRHYGIEGETELLADRLGFRYRPEHIRNPDFDGSTDGWKVDAAEERSVAARSMKQFSWLEGRYPPTRQGNTFLWMRRSAAGPNRVTQEIRGLRPGRLYSVKAICADYRDLSEGKSVPLKHGVTVRVEGAAPVLGKCFEHPIPNCYAHHVGPYNDKHRAWMTYQFILFRAQAATATLSLSDWAGEKEPGGPAGQELMCNFLEVQPYLEE